MRRRITAGVCALALISMMAGCAAGGEDMQQAITTAAEARERLELGNAAYLENDRNPAELSGEVRADTADGQHPYAVVVTCSDSRVPPEHIFSAGIGDIFVIRTAGNVMDEVALGSVAYGAEHLGAPLIFIMGHTNCGAVAATLSGGAHGSIGSITAEIAGCIGGETDASICEELNVRNSMERILADELIAQLVQEGKVTVLGGIYDITSGEVRYLS